VLSTTLSQSFAPLGQLSICDNKDLHARWIQMIVAFFTCKMRVKEPEYHSRSVISVFSSLPTKFILPEQTDFITISIKYYDYVCIFAFITRHANCIRIATDYVRSSMGWLAVR